jgi:charged multivesicular body protein 7
VESTLQSIDAAGDNAAVVRALAAGAKALATLNGEVGGVEGAEKVLDEVAERNAEVEEISAAVGEGAPIVDEGEVEGELEALEREVREKTRAEREEREKREEMKALDEVHELFREREREVERKKAEKEADGKATAETAAEDSAKDVDSSADMLKELQIA